MADYKGHTQTSQFNNRSVKEINKLRVLQYLFWNKGETQLSLSHALRLSPPTITQAIQQFKEIGLLVEGEEVKSSGGRKPRMIEFNYDAIHSIGVEIRRNHINIISINLNGEVVFECTQMLTFENTDNYWTAINTRLKEVIKVNPCIKRILGVGIAFPGEVSGDGQTIERATVLGIKNQSLENIKQYFDFDVMIENAANTAGFGAVWRAHGMADAVYLIVTDHGVAGSLIINNQIFKGSNCDGKAGAFGHMVLTPGGKPCFCGGRGCWSTYCALSNLTQYTNNDLDAFFALLNSGDAACKKLWEEYLTYFAQALSNIKLSLDMDIIIGGKIAKYLGEYLSALNVKVNAYPSLNDDKRYIIVDNIDGNSLAIGAALMFVDELLSGKSKRVPIR